MGVRHQPGRDAWRYMHELLWSGASHDRVHDACDAIGVTPPQMKALLSLEPGDARPMRTLAAEWRCDASWVTGLVDGLEDRGYVERKVHPGDRRVKTVVLTDLGAKAKDQLLERLHEPPPAMSVLTAAEQRTLRDLLRRIAEANA